MSKSQLERDLATQIKVLSLPDPVREYEFATPRRWRFDFCWPDRMLAVEVEGGVWTGGRHTRGSGFIKDCRKYNEAALLGWVVLRFPGQWIQNGKAIETLERAFAELEATK